MSEPTLDPEQRDDLSWGITTGCGCYAVDDLCRSCQDVFDATAPIVARMIGAARTEATEDVRAVFEGVRDHLDFQGQSYAVEVLNRELGGPDA